MVETEDAGDTLLILDASDGYFARGDNRLERFIAPLKAGTIGIERGASTWRVEQATEVALRKAVLGAYQLDLPACHCQKRRCCALSVTSCVG